MLIIPIGRLLKCQHFSFLTQFKINVFAHMYCLRNILKYVECFKYSTKIVFFKEICSSFVVEFLGLLYKQPWVIFVSETNLKSPCGYYPFLRDSYFLGFLIIVS